MFTPVESNIRFSDAVAAKNRGKCIPLSGRERHMYVGDAKLHDANFAFLKSALSKLHTQTYMPKVFFTYQDDIPVDVGGGFVDSVEYFSVNWAGIVNDTRNLFGNSGNIIPRINACMTQNKVPVYTYEVAYDLRFVELEKAKKLQLTKSIEQIYQEGIRAGWDCFVQRVAYLGISGGSGLFNHPNVQVTTIDNTGTTDKGFAGLSDDSAVAAINGIFMKILAASGMNASLLPNTLLVPTWMAEDLVSRYSPLYTNTLYDFIVEHNLGKVQGGKKFELTIVGRPDLNNAGVGGHGRIVAYRKEKDFARIDMPYPVQHYITLPNVERCSYTSIFVGQVSAVQLPYNSSSSEQGVVMYLDFSTEVSA